MLAWIPIKRGEGTAGEFVRVENVFEEGLRHLEAGFLPVGSEPEFQLAALLNERPPHMLAIGHA